MSLNWDITEVEDWEELVEDERESIITQTMVFQTIAVDLGTITEDNWADFYARNKIASQVFHAPLRLDGKPTDFTPEMVKRRIGLRTNVVNKTQTQFLNKIKQELSRTLQKEERRAIEQDDRVRQDAE